MKGIRIFDNTIVIHRIGATLGGKKGNIQTERSSLLVLWKQMFTLVEILEKRGS